MAERWPSFPEGPGWDASYPLLHRWSQIVGKVVIAAVPPQNHWWHSALQITATGLRTPPVPYRSGTFQLELDFVTHQLGLHCSGGHRQATPLGPLTVAGFQDSVLTQLDDIGAEITILGRPVELPDVLPFAEDHRGGYDPEAVSAWWAVMSVVDQTFREYQGAFLGKSSPVHFFWGAFDLAVTRFSGRTAPEHPGGVPNVADRVMREAYSHECASAGFWPGTPAAVPPSFYAYSYPEPDSYRERSVRPDAAGYDEGVGEYLLGYDSVATSSDPGATLRMFLDDAYAAAADAASWDRAALERRPTPG